MKPEPRTRKKVEAFDPHPQGSKHQMMAQRSKKLKEKKQHVEKKVKNRYRMRVVREKQSISQDKKSVKKNMKKTKKKKNSKSDTS